MRLSSSGRGDYNNSIGGSGGQAGNPLSMDMLAALKNDLAKLEETVSQLQQAPPICTVNASLSKLHINATVVSKSNSNRQHNTSNNMNLVMSLVW